MTKIDFLNDCEKNLIFESDNIHVTINDVAYCPFCRKEMKWQDHLYCDCKDQKDFFEKEKDILNKIESLNKGLDNLKILYTKKTLPFFISEAIKNITEIRESLNQEERDILSFASNPDE